MKDIIREYVIGWHQYAKDTQLYLYSPAISGKAEVLIQCLGKVMDWMRVNKFKINPDKTGAVFGWFIYTERNLPSP